MVRQQRDRQAENRLFVAWFVRDEADGGKIPSRVMQGKPGEGEYFK